MTETTTVRRAGAFAELTGPASLDVRFVGADGTEATFSFADLPCPGLRSDVAAAFQTRLATGEVTAVKTATFFYGSVRLFLTFLSELTPEPVGVADLTPQHMRAFHGFRADSTTVKTRNGRLWDACRLLRHVSPVDKLTHAMRTYLSYSRTAARWEGIPGDFDPIGEDAGDPLRVLFTAPDGRRRLFDFRELPLPALHADLAPSFTTLLYRNGQPLAMGTAQHLWAIVRRFLVHLTTLEEPPASIADVLPAHLEPLWLAWRQQRIERHADFDSHTLRNVLGNVRPYGRLSEELRLDLEQALCAPGAETPEPEAPLPQVMLPAPRPGRGRTSAMPTGPYQADAPAREGTGGLTVPFTGEDGRRKVFDFTGMALPAFHAEIVSAFAARTGPTGALRTVASADNSFGATKRFLAFLDTLPQRPATLGDLTVRHLDRFRMHRLQTTGNRGAMNDQMAIRLLLRHITPFDVLSQDLRDYLGHPDLGRGFRDKKTMVPGYSDREFRELMAAARTEVVAIRDRIRKGERLLDAFRTRPDTLTPEEYTLASHLDTMDRTGHVPLVRTDLNRPVLEGRLRLARHLFLTQADLAPLVVLAAGLSGRNAETIKDLPAEHRLLDGQAVAVNLVKRRRGKTNSRETVHWETGGSASRQLHTPGGFYLLLHQLTERSRRFSGSTRLWSIWAGTSGRRGANWDTKLAAVGHIDAFAQRLSRTMNLKGLAERHGLTDDSGNPLPISLNRVKTTVEVRHTKAMGGHLPSASRTNTLDVSFAHYLQGDPVVREWADEILTTAIDEAEQQARSHRPAVITPAHQLAQAPQQIAASLGTSPETLHRALGGELNTVVSSCLDILNSPFSDGVCDVSFLTCLRCPNALITHQHLPALLALVDELDRARQTMPIDAWVTRHGRTWLSLTRLILPQFTDAERAEAAKAKPATLGLDLLDGPKELG
ncbi:hypothetical protein [Streptomyces sp. NRRL WC-3742]|uniref:hypothetical protein n=1 Tax=Streptomyces sp. NRRL WC-3742 TaxID=1463934 RepID=UPI0004C6C6DC|nr:hypothetical protein [Streptomyces sp. NRRL WC-3742]